MADRVDRVERAGGTDRTNMGVGGGSDRGADSGAGGGNDSNVRSGSYLIARTWARCPHCRGSTRLVALLLPAGHESLDLDADADPEDAPDAEADADPNTDTDTDDAPGVHAELNAERDAAPDGEPDPAPDPAPTAAPWELSVSPAFLFYIERLPGAVERRLQRLCAGYRWAYCPAVLGSYFANHCQHCDSQLADHDLFCEPEGAFLPTGPAAAAAIERVLIEEPVEAAAAGYSACDFFEFMAAG